MMGKTTSPNTPRKLTNQAENKENVTSSETGHDNLFSSILGEMKAEDCDYIAKVRNKMAKISKGRFQKDFSQEFSQVT